MCNLKACVVCLSTETKLYNMDQFGLRTDYNTISSLNSYRENGLPSFLCVECTARLKTFMKFRNKCQRTNLVLLELLYKNNKITNYDIDLLDRKSLDIMPSLTYSKVMTSHYGKIQCQWLEMDTTSAVEANVIPTLYISSDEEVDSKPSRKHKRLHLSPTVTLVDFDKLKQEKLGSNMSFQYNHGSDEFKYNETENSSNSIAVEVPVLDDHIYLDESTNSDIDNEESKQDSTGEVNAGGDSLTREEAYAKVFSITDREQRAVIEIESTFSRGTYNCEVCRTNYKNKARLKIHMKRHEKHISGLFYCDVCFYYFKTELLLKIHQTERHLYKYQCTKCSEVSFNRVAAKQHYLVTHLKIKTKTDFKWTEIKRGYAVMRDAKNIKKIEKIGNHKIDKTVTFRKKYPYRSKDFPVTTPISHLEQYELIKGRQKSRNYIESNFKCDLCYKGYRNMYTFNNHLKMHDPDIAGPLQCDVCKMHFKNINKMYIHMVSCHVFKYSCQKCKYVCYNKELARNHYKWHENVTFRCEHCDKVFSKKNSKLSHIRIKHPSTDICNICGHSFVSQTGLFFHKQRSHSKEERDMAEKLAQNPSQDNLYCTECEMLFNSQEAFDTHMGSSKKHTLVNDSIQTYVNSRTVKKRERFYVGTSATNCEECGKRLRNYTQLIKHYKTEHPGTKPSNKYMCDVCGRTFKQHGILMEHIRTHTKPYACQFCDRRFGLPNNRDRHLIVHTEEKPYECEHCHRRFGHKNYLKRHVEIVHMKIPQKPRNKRRRKKNEPAPFPALPSTSTQLMENQGEYLDAYISFHNESK